MRRYLPAAFLFLAGVAAGWGLRPLPAQAGSSFDPSERSARALEKLADDLSGLRRAAERPTPVVCDCRK
jgi:hypothetical protein